jgi:molybdopterin-guanine dinucleotide biosynthesis protein A
VTAAGIVLAGGRSSRMGSAKADLEWHGSTLLRRVTGLVARAVDGPVVVVRAAGQPLPALPDGVEVVDDPREGLGPLQGLAAGLAAVVGAAEVAYLSATDVPFLHPAFVSRVLGALEPDDDIVLPHAHGHRQPLAAAYRTALAGRVAELVEAGELRPAALLARCRVRRLDETALLADPLLVELDPELDSLRSLDTPEAYAAARARPAPALTVRVGGAPPIAVRAATLAAAARAAGAELPAGADPEEPLAPGDVVELAG